jgi:hypothetical protein
MAEIEELEITFPGDIDVVEMLRATRVDDGTYRLEQSSGFGEVFYGDVIEVLPQPTGATRFVRLISRSGLRVSTLILTEQTLESEDLQVLLDRIVAVGGNWERPYGGVLFVHLPPDADIDLEAEVKGIRKLGESPL